MIIKYHHHMNMIHLRICCLFALFLIFTPATADSNFILILTDDQDVVLNGLSPMENVRKLLANNGAVFTNAVSYQLQMDEAAVNNLG